jgi:hypothetical protein
MRNHGGAYMLIGSHNDSGEPDTDNLEPARESIVKVKIKKDDTIGDVARRIGIPDNELGPNIFLNDEYSALTRKVKNGDRLGLFPDDMQLLNRWYFNRVT